MPTYEYACSACKHEWELEQSIKENAITECPSCHQQTAKRQISRGGGFILKGGGWYADLYSSSSNKSGEGGGKTEAKADAKPASAAPAAGASSSDASSSTASSDSSGASGTSTGTKSSTPAAS